MAVETRQIRKRQKNTGKKEGKRERAINTRQDKRSLYRKLGRLKEEDEEEEEEKEKLILHYNGRESPQSSSMALLKRGFDNVVLVCSYNDLRELNRMMLLFF